MAEIIQLKPKKTKPKIGIIVAARMTSKRFPGKSMVTLIDRPVIQWTLERSKLVRGPQNNTPKVVLAVPDKIESEPMLQLAEKLKIENFCGSELNVLQRLYHCAVFFKFDVIVRITGDCPFLEPKVCSEVLQLLMWRKLDYASNVFPKRTYPKGLDCEAFTFDALEAAYKLSDQLGDFEHVTPWMQRTKEVMKGNVEQRPDQSDKNWCVDEPEDIQRLEDIAKGTIQAMKAENEND